MFVEYYGSNVPTAPMRVVSWRRAFQALGDSQARGEIGETSDPGIISRDVAGCGSDEGSVVVCVGTGNKGRANSCFASRVYGRERDTKRDVNAPSRRAQSSSTGVVSFYCVGVAVWTDSERASWFQVLWVNIPNAKRVVRTGCLSWPASQLRPGPRSLTRSGHSEFTSGLSTDLALS